MPPNEFATTVQRHIQCFFDMSMHDAYIVSSISATTLRKCIRLNGETVWPFERIKVGGYKLDWNDIKQLREDAIQSTEGVPRDILLRAARVGNMRRRLFEKVDVRPPLSRVALAVTPVVALVAQATPAQEEEAMVDCLDEDEGGRTGVDEYYTDGGTFNIFGEPIDPTTGEPLPDPLPGVVLNDPFWDEL
jgi:hypothetical protein